MLNMRNSCKQVREDGSRCMAPPLTGSDFCFWHDPDNQEVAAEARRLGGIRRRREKTLIGAYDVGELASVDELRRLLQVAVLDTLALENSIHRSRTLGYLTSVGANLLEKSQFEGRLQALEETLGPRMVKPDPQERRAIWR